MHPLVVDKRVDDCDVDITRNGKWGNKFPLSDFTNRADCLAAHREWLRQPAGRRLLADLHELSGKRLGCVCAPRACHGDTLARMANNPWTVKAYAKP